MKQYIKEIDEYKCNCGGKVTVSEVCNINEELSDDNEDKFSVTCELKCDCCKEPLPNCFRSQTHCKEYHIDFIFMSWAHSGLDMKEFIESRYE